MRRVFRSLVILALATVSVACGGGLGGGSPGSGGGGGGTVVPGTTAYQYNLDRVNELRASVGAPPLVLDPVISAFATAGSQQLLQDHTPHAHMQLASDLGTLFTTDGFVGGAAENQGDPFGWPSGSAQEQIAEILQMMWDEGPGTGAAHGHYNNLVNPAFTRLGVGLVLDATGRLYFTNDFSG